MSIDMLDIDLGTPDGRALLDALEHDHGKSIAAAAARFQDLFLLRSPWAPGLRFAGGLTRPVEPRVGCGAPQRLSSSGTGLTIPNALASCFGEAVERLSQIERPEDTAVEAPLDEVAQRIPLSIRKRIENLAVGPAIGDVRTAWVLARNARTGADVLVPADWCLRRSSPGQLQIPDGALSSGVAAGPTWETAALRAVLELIERDAASLWWTAGRRGTLLPLESGASRAAVQQLDRLRQGCRDRRSWLVDISTDLQVPVFAALSVNGDGKGLACGLAARLDAESAVNAAILEMAQMEVGLLVTEAKLAAGGGATMHAAERALVDRARHLDAAACSLLHPTAPGTEINLDWGATDTDRYTALITHLHEHDIDLYMVDATRSDLGIPVAAAIAPTLQLMPGAVITDRLRRATAEAGGGMPHTNGLSLF